jgi:branched-chain amino acid transport system permease protein
MDYIFHVLIILNIYIILSSSTSLLVGYTNLVSMGQAGFYGIGAYITALCLLKLNLTLIPSLLIVVSFNAIVSLFISSAAIRLKGDFFTLATIGFQLIVFSILYNWVSVTKGPYGISGIPTPYVIGQIQVVSTGNFLALSTIFSIFTIILIKIFVKSPFGRLMKAIKEDEISLSSLGRNPSKIKTITFFIATGLVGFASFIYASYITFIDPTSFNLDESLFILSSVLIGGSGNTKGPIVGAVFVVLLPEILRYMGIPSEIAAPTKQIIYGMSIILMMRLKPQGLLGSFKFEN